MGYLIVGILCFIGGWLVEYFINKQKMIKVDLENDKLVELIKENANKELEKIKERLGKAVKEKDRDELIKDIDDYFSRYGCPNDECDGDSG